MGPLQLKRAASRIVQCGKRVEVDEHFRSICISILNLKCRSGVADPVLESVRCFSSIVSGVIKDIIALLYIRCELLSCANRISIAVLACAQDKHGLPW